MRSNVYLRHYKTKNEKRYYLVVREYGQGDQTIQLGPISKKLAEERRVQILHELLTGSFRREPQVHLFLSEFVERFILDFAVGSRSPRTVEIYREMLKPFLKLFGSFRLNQMTRRDLETYLSGREVSGRTKNIERNVLQLLFRKAVEWKSLAHSPAEAIPRFQEESQGSRALTPSELERLWEGLTAWQQSVIRILIYSGMRPGELSNLKLKDIHWEENYLEIACDKDRKTKNRKPRRIPLNKDLREELLLLKDFRPIKGGHTKRRYKPRLPNQRDFVFCHEDGSKVVSFRHSILRAFKAHGIQGVTPHGLRKTFCSQLARHKVHPRVAQQLMGHSKIDLTMRVYTEVDDDQLREAMDSLPSMHHLKRKKFRVVDGKK